MKSILRIVSIACLSYAALHAQESVPVDDFDSQAFYTSGTGEAEVVMPFESPLFAQRLDSSPSLELTPESSSFSDSARADSLRPVVKRKLLPDNMSFVERGLWGESGLLRSVGLASPLTPEVRKSELSLRRTMLTVHQIGGFVTLGLLATTVYYGQRTLDNFNNSQFRSLRQTHSEFVTFSIFSYTATGLLAVLSPPPLIRRNENSTTTLHKTLAWVHVAGMIITPIIGSQLRHNKNELQLAHYHQVAGYITTGVLALSLIVVTF
ncbi:MAG: hypothetical protein ABSF91_06770 [Bacteroidota bacterium]|jgi:hypothetical protein